MAERAAHAINHQDDHLQQQRLGEDEGLFGDEDPNNNCYMHIVPSGGAFPMSAPYATYIVQIPKDQIYRIPPPENAEIVQRYRNPDQNNKQGSGRRRRCGYWFLSIVFMVAFIISVIVCVHKFTLTPKPPSFSIKHLLVNPKSMGFQISMETSNPNKVNDLGYKQGTVSLMYKEKQIGKGVFPALKNQAPGITDPIEATLSSKAALPKDLEITSTKKGNNLVSMSLSMQIPIEMKTWLSSNTVDFNITCDFEAEPLRNLLKIQSESCDVRK